MHAEKQVNESAHEPLAVRPKTSRAFPNGAGGRTHSRFGREGMHTHVSGIVSRPNHTGMPNHLKSALESMSGFDMSPVRVHYNSPEPAKLGALAYTKGTDIHLGLGQERVLPHEAWHVVQQMQGRVRPTTRYKGFDINSDRGLEREASVMGEMATRLKVEQSTLFGLGNTAWMNSTQSQSLEQFSISSVGYTVANLTNSGQVVQMWWPLSKETKGDLVFTEGGLALTAGTFQTVLEAVSGSGVSINAIVNIMIGVIKILRSILSALGDEPKVIVDSLRMIESGLSFYNGAHFGNVPIMLFGFIKGLRSIAMLLMNLLDDGTNNPPWKRELTLVAGFLHTLETMSGSTAVGIGFHIADGITDVFNAAASTGVFTSKAVRAFSQIWEGLFYNPGGGAAQPAAAGGGGAGGANPPAVIPAPAPPPPAVIPAPGPLPPVVVPAPPLPPPPPAVMPAPPQVIPAPPVQLPAAPLLQPEALNVAIALTQLVNQLQGMGNQALAPQPPPPAAVPVPPPPPPAAVPAPPQVIPAPPVQLPVAPLHQLLPAALNVAAALTQLVNQLQPAPAPVPAGYDQYLDDDWDDIDEQAERYMEQRDRQDERKQKRRWKGRGNW